MTAAPLAGRTVLVLRVPSRARALAELLRGLGARVLVAPVTATAPALDAAALDDAVRGLAGFAWVAVTSVNGVEALVEAAARTGVALDAAPVRWAAVGPATAAALREAGVRVEVESAGTAGDLFSDLSERGSVGGEPGSDSPAPLPCVSEPGHTPVGSGSDTSVLLPLGDLARTTLSDGLAALGWSVTGVVAYRTVPVDLPDDIADLARAGGIDAAVVAAGSAARELARQLGADAPPVVAIGEPSATAARQAGLTVVATAAAPTDVSLTEALTITLDTTPRSIT